MWNQKVKSFVIDMTAWLGAGVEIVLAFVGTPAWGIAISAAVVAAIITVEGLIPTNDTGTKTL